MRGVWWGAIVISGLIGGIAGAALLFGLTQAFGDGSSGHQPVVARASHTVSTKGTATAAEVAPARNGLDAAGIFDRVRPSVVTVETTTVGRRRRDEGEGSGIVLDTNGHILTNYHVVDGVTQMQVRLGNGHIYTATVLASDQGNDLAVIGISAPAASLHPATIGDPSTLRVGEPVLAIGNPLGYEATLTEGVISGLDRTFNDQASPPMQHLVQSDAAINPGNSGGPLLNGRGEVVGVNTLLDNADGTNAFVGLGFAVPIDAARDVIQRAAQGK